MKSFLFYGMVCAGWLACAEKIPSPYIPEPQPAESDYEIMALYYPGTEHMPEWDVVEQVTPDAKPLLGWYDEGDPENIDWQIKWAVEHGITSFCVCWYWDFGERRLEHWVDAFPKAKFKKHLKWCLLNCTWNFRPNTDTPANQEAMTRFWIERYFCQDEYYRIDGKPVVAYCSSDWTDQGMIAEAKSRGEILKPGEGIKRALEISNRLAKEAGFPGIYWVDLRWMRNANEWNFTPEGFVSANVGGFDACTSYNLGGETPFYMCPEARKPGDRPRWCDFDMMCAAAKNIAEHADRMPGGVPFWPILPTGYDDTSRAYQHAWVVHDRTPEKFRACCRDIKDICDRKGLKRIVVSPVNEWQEGSYAEPNEKYGFAMYDAIRDTFCKKPAAGWPKNLSPKDLGRPLKEFPPMYYSPVQNWTFDDSTEGWYRQQFGCPVTLCKNGALHFITARDFQFHIRQRMVPFNAGKYTKFRLRMKVKPDPVWGLGRFGKKGAGMRMRLKWGTEEEPIIGNCNAVDFVGMIASAPVNYDGDWHEYELDLSACDDWKGMVNELWFEAINASGAFVDIDWMKFE